MPEITLKIPCEAYLAQWYINDSGGATPVKLRKNSPEQHLLRCLLVSKNSAAVMPQPDQRSCGMDGQASSPGGCGEEPEDPEVLEIIIPYFKGMSPEIYNHISPRAERIFTDTLRKRFDLRIFEDLAPVINAVDRRDELIWAWMEANGIEETETNWAAVEKRLRRMLDRLKTKIRVREWRKKRITEK